MKQQIERIQKKITDYWQLFLGGISVIVIYDVFSSQELNIFISLLALILLVLIALSLNLKDQLFGRLFAVVLTIGAIMLILDLENLADKAASWAFLFLIVSVLLRFKDYLNRKD